MFKRTPPLVPHRIHSVSQSPFIPLVTCKSPPVRARLALRVLWTDCICVASLFSVRLVAQKKLVVMYNGHS